MIFRRLASAIRVQNWFTVFIELLIVIVGIFLALQAEDWYSKKQQIANAQSRIVELASDFEWNREQLRLEIEGRESVRDAALELLVMDEQSPSIDDYHRFYTLLAETSITMTPRLRRGAYDVLIATGQIDLIADQALMAEVASFYALVDELIIFNQGTWLVDRNIFEPFVIGNLDYVQALQYVHPIERPHGIEQRVPAQKNDAFLEVIGSAEFEGVIGAKWHATRDEIIRLEGLNDRLTQIEDRIGQIL